MSAPEFGVKIHPLVDHGLQPGDPAFAGGALVCLCADDPVRVELASPVAHVHACGCPDCWKPADALFALLGVAPADRLAVVAGQAKLHVASEAGGLRRHGCSLCGAHLYGVVHKPADPFAGLAFVHTERFERPGAPPPAFAAYVARVIEQGVHPDRTAAIRTRLRDLGLAPYDCFSPPLMDYIATFNAKLRGVLPI